MSSRQCIVPSCDSDKDVQKHYFPKSSAIRMLWVNAVKNPLLSALPYEEVNRRRFFFCRRHFAGEYIILTGRRPLSKGAIPTLCLPEESDQHQENVTIDADRINEDTSYCGLTLPVSLSPSLNYNRSPVSKDLRRSSLVTPNTSPLKSTSVPISRKRLLIEQGDFTAKELKTKTLEDANQVECLLDITNVNEVAQCTTPTPAECVAAVPVAK